MHDRIIFDVLNPLTVDKMLSASEVIEQLLARPADDDRFVRYRGMKFSRASLERARHLYELAIYKYLSIRLDGGEFPADDGTEPYEWVDIAGLPMRREGLRRAMEADSLEKFEAIFDEALERFRELELEWIGVRFAERWRRTPEVIADYAREFDHMVEEDRARYLDDLNAQNEMLAL